MTTGGGHAVTPLFPLDTHPSLSFPLSPSGTVPPAPFVLCGRACLRLPRGCPTTCASTPVRPWRACLRAGEVTPVSRPRADTFAFIVPRGACCLLGARRGRVRGAGRGAGALLG